VKRARRTCAMRAALSSFSFTTPHCFMEESRVRKSCGLDRSFRFCFAKTFPRSTRSIISHQHQPGTLPTQEQRLRLRRCSLLFAHEVDSRSHVQSLTPTRQPNRRLSTIRPTRQDFSRCHSRLHKAYCSGEADTDTTAAAIKAIETKRQRLIPHSTRDRECTGSEGGSQRDGLHRSASEADRRAERDTSG